jgi:hypothetical protein
MTEIFKLTGGTYYTENRVKATHSKVEKVKKLRSMIRIIHGRHSIVNMRDNERLARQVSCPRSQERSELF